jgi:diguanylate cyclase (GGDEF)-like protein
MSDEPESLPIESFPPEIARLRAEIARLQAELATAAEEARALRSLAHEDALTRLLNRRGFEQDLARALAYARRYRTPAAVLLIDLDRFKPINDRHGHQAGDAALRHVADLLRSHLRASDLVARLGGDEFAVLLWQVDAVVARQKADSLEDVLSLSPCAWKGVSLPVSGSIGAAPITPADDPAAVLARADEAMYRRKAERRGRARPELRAVRR